jgi:hypothetical protein
MRSRSVVTRVLDKNVLMCSSLLKQQNPFEGIRMKTKTLPLLCAITLFAALGITVQTFSQKIQDQFITFDVPGAGRTGTNPTSINPSDTITGYYLGADNLSHGFVRDKDGTIITFDGAPGGGIVPLSINPSNEITGWTVDANHVYHGFVRDKDGTITAFDVPGASGPLVGTAAASINPSGAITGDWKDSGNVVHGFIRDRDGTITTFDVPDASATYTAPTSISPTGDITGYYYGASLRLHGFVRDKDGTITTFESTGRAPAAP